MLSFTIQDLGDITIFRCVGRITAESRNRLRDAVVAQTDIRRTGTRIVVLDLAEVTTVDAAGLGELVSLQTWAKAAGRELKLMNVLPRVESILELTHLQPAFEICSLGEMVDLLCRASHVGAGLPIPWDEQQPRRRISTYGDLSVKLRTT
jgi:anti-anti-sigma factor